MDHQRQSIMVCGQEGVAWSSIHSRSFVYREIMNENFPWHFNLMGLHLEGAKVLTEMSNLVPTLSVAWLSKLLL